MLRWLLAKLPKRVGVLGALWLISGIAHGLILCVALILGGISTDARQALVVTGMRRQTDARIVLLPMLKTVRNTQYDKPVRGTSLTANAATKKPSVLKTTPAKTLKSNGDKKPSKAVNIKPKVLDKKSGKTLLASKEKDKKIEEKKKQESKQIKTESDKKDIPKHIEQKQPVVAQQEIKDEPKPVDTVKEEQVFGDPNATQDLIYVGRDDLREMQTQGVVADALQKQWQPPSGIAKDTFCQIAFDIDAEGKACNIVMKQNSKVLIFDIAARTAIVQAHFSPASHGRQFTVAFKP